MEGIELAVAGDDATTAQQPDDSSGLGGDEIRNKNGAESLPHTDPFTPDYVNLQCCVDALQNVNNDYVVTSISITCPFPGYMLLRHRAVEQVTTAVKETDINLITKEKMKKWKKLLKMHKLKKEIRWKKNIWKNIVHLLVTMIGIQNLLLLIQMKMQCPVYPQLQMKLFLHHLKLQLIIAVYHCRSIEHFQTVSSKTIFKTFNSMTKNAVNIASNTPLKDATIIIKCKM